MQPYQDDRRPDSTDDVDNQEPVQTGRTSVGKIQRYYAPTRPRVVIKNHRSEPYATFGQRVWERLRCLSHCCHADADDIEKIPLHGMLTIFLRLKFSLHSNVKIFTGQVS
jgi:hypothetical protein